MYDDNSQHETRVLVETQRDERGHSFLPPNRGDLPGRFDQEERAEPEAVIYLHYTSMIADWWVAELWQDRDTGKWMAYGYWRPTPDAAVLWDSFCLTDLERLVIPMTAQPNLQVGNVITVEALRLMVTRDLEWIPAPAHEVVPGVARQEVRDA